MSFLSYRLEEKLIKLERQQYADMEFKDASMCFKLSGFGLKYSLGQFFASKPKADCLNIGLVFSGGIGDQVISAQWAKAFLERLEQEHVNFYACLCFPSEKTGQMIAQGFPHVDQITNHKFFKKHKFDLLLGLDYFLKFWSYDREAINKYAPSMSQAFEKAYQDSLQFSPVTSFYLHFQLMDQCLAKGINRYDLMGLNGLCEFDRNTKPFFAVDQQKVQESLAKFGLVGKKFVTIHSGVGGIPKDGLAIGKDLNEARQYATRVLPSQLGEEIALLLRQEVQDVTIVQIGEPDGIKLNNVDQCLIGKTSFKESLDLLSAAVVHIDNDSGLVHIRHAMNKRSVVLWGPTDGAFVGYPEDENLQASCHACMWLTHDWNLNCARGYECARCMKEHSPVEVVARVKKLLALLDER